MPAFWNYWTIGALNQTFKVNGSADKNVTTGLRTIHGVLNDWLALAQGTVAAMRLGVSSTGHVTIDNNGGAAFTVTWVDTNLRDMLGYTADLGGTNSYPAPRRMAGTFYLEHGGGPLAAVMAEYEPTPELANVSQTRSLGQVKRSTRSGVVADDTVFDIRHVDRSARLVSPAGAPATTYANAATTELGLYLYDHARDRWWDSTAGNLQGWSDGRPVMYFPSSTDASYAVSAAPVTISSALYTTWVFDEACLKRWPGVKATPPKTSSYHVLLRASEYVAP